MKTYSHSGAVSPTGAIGALVASLAAAVLCGFLYAYAFAYIPHIVLNVAVTVIFGLALGFIVAQAAERGKIRNNLVVGCLAVLTALFALYVYWGAYFWAFVGFNNIRQVGLYAFTPGGLYQFGAHLFAKGSWSFSEGNPVRGTFLASLWVLEAVVVTGLTVIVSQWNAQRPFCETCQSWTNEQRSVARLLATGGEPAWTNVLNGELPALAEFEPAPPGSRWYVRLDLARCPTCEHSRFLSISQVMLHTDDKGQTKEVTRALISNAILSPAQCAVVEACGQLYRQNLEADLDQPDLQPDAAEAGGSSAPDDEQGEAE